MAEPADEAVEAVTNAHVRLSTEHLRGGPSQKQRPNRLVSRGRFITVACRAEGSSSSGYKPAGHVCRRATESMGHEVQIIKFSVWTAKVAEWAHMLERDQKLVGSFEKVRPSRRLTIGADTSRLTNTCPAMPHGVEEVEVSNALLRSFKTSTAHATCGCAVIEVLLLSAVSCTHPVLATRSPWRVQWERTAAHHHATSVGRIGPVCSKFGRMSRGSLAQSCVVCTLGFFCRVGRCARHHEIVGCVAVRTAQVSLWVV